MKKSIISASIAAMIGGLGLAGVANAAVIVPATNVATQLQINEAGTGHILVVPYFTTQGTNATLLNITNTDTANGKAVKVRFRGASNSDDIFDFTLLLSPGDVWAAKVSQGADGVSRLETSDKTCTLPATVATQANSFPTNRLNPALSAADRAAQTREGYIEILTMADIPKAGFAAQAATVAAGTPTVNPLWTAVKHVGGVAPCTAATLSLLATDPVASQRNAATILLGNAGQEADGTVADNVNRPTTAGGMGLTFPTGQLMANWTIIDTVKTATFSGAAVAIRANHPTVAANVNANLVLFPQSDALVGVTVNNFTADPLLRTDSWRIATGATALSQATTATITASMYDLPDLSTPYLAATTDARAQASNLTTQLAARAVMNEYLTTTSIAATTDWVFSMPTRRYNVALNYGYSNPLGGDGRVYTSMLGTTATANGSGNYVMTNVGTFFSPANTAVADGKICVATNGPTSYDREETTTTTGFVISPGTVNVVRFCGETSVLGINNGTGAATGSMSATVAMQNLNLTTGNEGWLSIGTLGLSSATTTVAAAPNPDTQAGAITSYAATSPATIVAAPDFATAKGLPVLGAAFVKSSSFGAVWPHRFTR